MSRPEAQLLDTIPFQPHRTRRQYERQVYATFRRAGVSPIKAVMDEAGNCVACGEAGRCPGWHLNDGRMRG